MDKKNYNGLQAEYISFGDNDMDTLTITPESGCAIGSVMHYTSDENFTPVPLGQCWYNDDPDMLGLVWASPVGSVSL